MSWRETLGVTPSAETPYTHNSHNPQKPTEQGNCADIADSAYRDSEQESSKLLETLADTCKGLDITPPEVKGALAPEDIDDWRKGAISADTLAAFASLFKEQSMLACVSTCDLVVLSLCVGTAIAEDMTRRNVDPTNAFAFASLPVIGPTLWLLTRPPLEE